MGAISGLCNRALWVEQGGIRQAGPAEDVVAAYERSALEHGAPRTSVARPAREIAGRRFYFAGVSLRNGSGAATTGTASGPGRKSRNFSATSPASASRCSA